MVGAFYYLADNTGRLRATLWIAGLFIGLIMTLNFLEIDRQDVGRVFFLIALLTGDFSIADFSSARSAVFNFRTVLWSETISLILQHPLGVGLGSWSDYVKTIRDNPYAHNLFLELWSEGGIILGTIACLPLLAFLAVKKSPFWFVAFALLIAQMFSGNLADARQMYAFALIASLSILDDVRPMRIGLG